jgi:hypothetical protein
VVDGTEIVEAQRVIVVTGCFRLTRMVTGSPGFTGVCVVVEGAEIEGAQRVIVVYACGRSTLIVTGSPGI